MQIGVQAHLNGIVWSSEFRTVVQRLVFIFFSFSILKTLYIYKG